MGALPFRRELEALARGARITLDAPEDPPEAQPELNPPSSGEDQVAALEAAQETARTRYQLSHRELEVWMHLPEGLTNNEIGDRLYISGKTASVHVTNILRKLGFKSRVQAITVAHQLGLVIPAEEAGTGPGADSQAPSGE